MMMALPVLLSCEKAGLFKKHHHKVTLPFKATFLTTLSGLDPSQCGADTTFALNTQEGYGTEEHFGNFTVKITFCVNLTNLEYDNVQGKFVFDNGDELWLTGGGQVVPSDDPNYALMFKDPFKIVGGTGHFKGAKGEGTTSSYVDFNIFQTDHVWSGEITLYKNR